MFLQFSAKLWNVSDKPIPECSGTGIQARVGRATASQATSIVLPKRAQAMVRIALTAPRPEREASSARRDDRERFRAAGGAIGRQFQKIRRRAGDRLVEHRAIAAP